MSADHYTDQIEEIVRVDSSQPIAISIENQNGDVLVRGADRADVLIRAEKHGNRSSVIYQESYFLIEADDTRISVSPVIPPISRGGPSVAVDLDLDVGAEVADAMRDLFGSHRREEREQRQREREQRHKERRSRRGRGFKFTWDNSDVSYEIVIEVPRGLEYRLDINTASGSMDVRDITGDIKLSTASGEAALSQLVGEIAVNTASGDLRVQRTAGQLVTRSASGDTRIERSAFNAFGFHTASGDLQLDAALTGNGPYRIETVSGDSRLAIAALNPASGAERGMEISFQSMSGDARLDREFQRQGSGRWVVGGAEPGPHLVVSTVSGDLNGKLGASPEARALGLRTTAQKAAERAPAPPAPPAPVAPVSPAAPAAVIAEEDQMATDAVHTGGLEDQAVSESSAAERLALLEAVERGEIDIDEALQRLEDRKDAATEPE